MVQFNETPLTEEEEEELRLIRAEMAAHQAAQDLPEPQPVEYVPESPPVEMPGPLSVIDAFIEGPAENPYEDTPEYQYQAAPLHAFQAEPEPLPEPIQAQAGETLDVVPIDQGPSISYLQDGTSEVDEFVEAVEAGPVAFNPDVHIQKNSNIPFVRRIVDPKKYPKKFISPEGEWTDHRTSDEDLELTHRLMYTSPEKPIHINGKEAHIVYPSMRYNNPTKGLYEDRDPYTAVAEGNYIEFDSAEDAKKFASTWKSSFAWQAGQSREFGPTPVQEDPIYPGPFTSPDAGAGYSDPFFEDDVKSERPSTVVNKRRFYLDAGESPNPKLNLARQVIETVSYGSEVERQLALEAMAAAAVEEASNAKESDRPNDAKYGKDLTSMRNAFRAMGDFNFVEAGIDSFNALFFEQGATPEASGSTILTKGGMRVRPKGAYTDSPELEGQKRVEEGPIAENETYQSPTLDEYAEMLLSNSTRAFDAETRNEAFKYLNKYLGAQEQIKPQDLFVQSENVTGTGGKLATQLLQLTTLLPTIPVSGFLAATQGRARNRGEVTGDVNYANILNAEQANQVIDLRGASLNADPKSVEAQKVRVYEDTFAVMRDPSVAAARTSGMFALYARIGGRSHNPKEGSFETVKMMPSDIEYILDPKNLIPYQKGLWEHINKVYYERVPAKLAGAEFMEGIPAERVRAELAGSELMEANIGVLDSPRERAQKVKSRRAVQESALRGAFPNSPYWSKEAIFERLKLSSALSWADAIDPDNADSLFLQGYRPIRPPKEGWAMRKAQDDAKEEWLKHYRGESEVAPWEGAGSNYRSGVNPWSLKNELREHTYRKALGISSERIGEAAKAGAFGQAFQNEAGVIMAQVFTEVATRQQASEFDTVVGEYAQRMAESMSPEMMWHDFTLSFAGATGIGDPKLVAEGKEFWNNYPLFGVLNVAMGSAGISKLAVKPAIKHGVTTVGAAIEASPALQKVSQAFELFKEGDVAGAKALYVEGMTEYKAQYKTAKEVQMEAFKDAEKLASSPISRKKEAAASLDSPENVIRISGDDVQPTINQKRREAQEFEAKADELAEANDPTARAYRDKAQFARDVADALEVGLKEELQIKSQQAGESPRRTPPPEEVQRREEIAADISNRAANKDTVGIRKLREALKAFWNTDHPNNHKLLAHLRTDAEAAKDYARRIASTGETDVRVYLELLGESEAALIQDLVYRAENAPVSKNLRTVLDEMAAKNNTTPEALMAQQNRLSTAEQLAHRGEKNAAVYEALGISDNYIDYFVNMAERRSASKAYVTSRVFGDGLELTIKNAPHRGRFQTGIIGAAQVARRNLLGEKADALVSAASKNTRAVNYGLAVAEFMERPFSFANIPSWYSDVVNYGLHHQIAKNHQSGFGKFLEHLFMYSATNSSLLGRDVYHQIQRAGGVEQLAKADIEAATKELLGGDFDLRNADVANALRELGIFSEEFGTEGELLQGLTTLAEDQFQFAAELIHRGLIGEKIDVGGFSIDVADVMRLQVKRRKDKDSPGVWEDAIDERGRMEEIKTRKGEIDATLQDQLTKKEIEDSVSLDPKDVAKIEDLQLRLQKQKSPEELAALKQERDALVAEAKDIRSITQQDALEGVESIRWVPALDENGNQRTYASMGPKEREMLAVANNTVQGISSKIFSVGMDLILGQQALDISIQSARPKGVIVRDMDVVSTRGTWDRKEAPSRRKKYKVLRDFGDTKQAQERAARVAAAINELTHGREMPQGISAADQKFVRATVKELGENEKVSTQTRQQYENHTRVVGESPLKFQGYEVIPRLVNYVSSYFLREAEAGHITRILGDYKKWLDDEKAGKPFEERRGISPEQYKVQVSAVAQKYLQLFPDQKKVQEFVDKKNGKGTFKTNPVKALETLMDTAKETLDQNGIVMQGDARFFKTRLWAKDLSFEQQLESLASYRESAAKTYVGLVQRREVLRLQTMLRENGLLVSDYELNTNSGLNRNSYVKGDAIPLPRMAEFGLLWKNPFEVKTKELKVGDKTVRYQRPGLKDAETVQAGGAMSDFYIHKSVARYYAQQHVLVKAQESALVKINNMYKIGAVVNPITGTMVRNLIGMYTFQSVAADIPFRGTYWRKVHNELKKVRAGDKSADPVIRRMVEEGVLGNLIVELGDSGAARAATESFLVDVFAGKDNKGTVGEFMNSLDSTDLNNRAMGKLLDGLMGSDQAWNGLADNISLIRATDDAARPGQIPKRENLFEVPSIPRAISASLKKGRQAYGSIDDIGRASYAYELVKNHNFTVRDAVIRANQVMFDYPDVSMFTAMLRTNPFSFGMPFIGYTVWANEAFANLLTKHTPRAYMIAGAAKAQIAVVEAMLGTPDATRMFASTEYDPGALPMPAYKIQKAKGYAKRRLKGKRDEYVGGPEFMRGAQFSAFMDPNVWRRIQMAETKSMEDLSMLEKLKYTGAALLGSQGFTGEAASSLFLPSVRDNPRASDLEQISRAKLSVRLDNIKEDGYEDANAVVPEAGDIATRRFWQNTIKHQPYFNAAIRGLVGIYSAATGEDTLGMGATGRDVIQKFLGISTTLYDERFKSVLQEEGRAELSNLKAAYKGLIEMGKRLDIENRAGVRNEAQIEMVNIYANHVYNSISKIKGNKNAVKASHRIKVQAHLDKMQVYLKALVLGQDVSLAEYEASPFGGPEFSLPSPAPTFDDMDVAPPARQEDFDDIEFNDEELTPEEVEELRLIKEELGIAPL